MDCSLLCSAFTCLTSFSEAVGFKSEPCSLSSTCDSGRADAVNTIGACAVRIDSLKLTWRFAAQYAESVR
eukprot:4401534-Pleurochrysis_carterae.AAC.2